MAKTNYNVQLANAVKKMLDKQGFKYEWFDDNAAIRFGCNLGKNQELQNARMTVYFQENGFTSYATASISAEESNIDSVAEYITRANYGLRVGNFEVDYNDGEVRFKSHHISVNIIPSEEDLDFLVFAPLYMWKKYGNGFVKVLLGGVSPKSAIEEAEAGVRTKTWT